MEYTDRNKDFHGATGQTPEQALPHFIKAGVLILSQQDEFACDAFAAYIQAVEEDPEWEHLSPQFWDKFNEMFGIPE